MRMMLVVALMSGCGGNVLQVGGVSDACVAPSSALACPNGQACSAGACRDVPIMDALAIAGELLPLAEVHTAPFATGAGTALSATFRLGSDWAIVDASLPDATEKWVHFRGTLHGAACELAEGPAADWLALPSAHWRFTGEVACNDEVSALLGQSWTLIADGHI